MSSTASEAALASQLFQTDLASQEACLLLEPCLRGTYSECLQHVSSVEQTALFHLWSTRRCSIEADESSALSGGEDARQAWANSGHTDGYTDPRYSHVEFRGAPSAAPAGHGLVTRHPLRSHKCIGHFRAGRVLLPAGSPSCAPGFARRRCCSEPLNGPFLVPLRRHLSAFFDNYITLRVSLLRPDWQILSKCNHA